MVPVGGGVGRTGLPEPPLPVLTMRARLLPLLVLIGLLAGCGASTAAPRPIVADGGDAASVTEVQTDAAGTSSAAGPGSLAQLLTAPRPVALPPAAVPTGPPAPPPDPYKTGPRPESPVIIPPPPLGPGDGTVYAVGDSVLLGTKDYLTQTVGGWDLRFDGKVGRRFPEGIDLIRGNRDSIGQAVVVLLGHNYGGGGQVYGYLDEIMSVLRTTPRVVFVTVKEWNPAIPEVNRAIRALPATYPNVVVADWSGVVNANPQFLVDNVHLNAAGSIALANLIAVMLGPANKNGTTVPPLKILPIPDGGSSTPSTPVTTAAPGATTTTSSSTTTTSAPATTTTTVAPPSSTTTSTAPAVTTSTAPPPPPSGAGPP